MAELIDKQTAIKAVAENMALGYFSKVVNTVAELPTTTEAEIRNRAIHKFAERVLDYWDKRGTAQTILFLKDVAEQLKEE